jgi:hypothetical protein
MKKALLALRKKGFLVFDLAETKTFFSGESLGPRHKGVAHNFLSFHDDPSYLAPGAVWGTIAGAVTVVGPAKRPGFMTTVLHDTGKVVDLILNERHSSPSLPGYDGMFKRLPKAYWPKRKP